MKKIILLALTAIMMAGCNNAQRRITVITDAWGVEQINDTTYIAVPAFKSNRTQPFIMNLKTKQELKELVE